MIHLANDHGGYRLGMKLFDKMVEKKLHISHHGCCSSDISTDYPVFAKRVVEEVQFLDFAVGILICGTGIGISMAAAKMVVKSPRMLSTGESCIIFQLWLQKGFCRSAVASPFLFGLENDGLTHHQF